MFCLSHHPPEAGKQLYFHSFWTIWSAKNVANFILVEVVFPLWLKFGVGFHVPINAHFQMPTKNMVADPIV